MGDVALRAGVSKALVHYHFRDKESLLLALAEEVGRDVLARERHIMSAQADGHALNLYWEWLAAEINRRDVIILLALAQYDSERVRAVSRRIASARRALAAEHVDQLFGRLGLVPRVPALLLAETIVAFTDGLCAATALEPDRDPRPAFDALWLALLTLAE